MYNRQFIQFARIAVEFVSRSSTFLKLFPDKLIVDRRFKFIFLKMHRKYAVLISSNIRILISN